VVFKYRYSKRSFPGIELVFQKLDRILKHILSSFSDKFSFRSCFPDTDIEYQWGFSNKSQHCCEDYLGDETCVGFV